MSENTSLRERLLAQAAVAQQASNEGWYGPQASPVLATDAGLLREAYAALSHHASSTTPASGGDGMLPDTLMAVSSEWYTLCERAPHAFKIGISGELAQAIVATVCRAAPPATRAPGVETADLAELAYWRREHGDDLHHRRYGDGTTHAQRIAEHRAAALAAQDGGSK